MKTSLSTIMAISKKYAKTPKMETLQDIRELAQIMNATISLDGLNEQDKVNAKPICVVTSNLYPFVKAMLVNCNGEVVYLEHSKYLNMFNNI